MKYILTSMVILLALACAPLQAEQMLTEVIPTRRDAGDLVQILKPLVPAPGSISSFRNQLIIKTSEENLAEIKAVLGKLDKALENLLISVRFSDDAEVRRDLAASHVRISGGKVSAGARLQRSLTTTTGNEVHALRVLEGQQAFIRTGQSVPLVEEQTVVTGFGINTNHSIRFEEFGSGFYVRPRLNGDQVTLEISAQRRRLEGQSNAINSARVQETSTHVSGILGRWMEIAGVNSAARRRAQGSGSTRLRTTRQDNNIYVKVERLGY